MDLFGLGEELLGRENWKLVWLCSYLRDRDFIRDGNYEDVMWVVWSYWREVSCDLLATSFAVHARARLTFHHRLFLCFFFGFFTINNFLVNNNLMNKLKNNNSPTRSPTG